MFVLRTMGVWKAGGGVVTRVSFDPGLRVSALAVWQDDTMVHAQLVRSECKKERGPYAWLTMARAVSHAVLALGITVDRMIVESQQVYGKVIGDPDNLIQLAGVNGAVVAMVDAPEHVSYLPRQWKGSIKKEDMLTSIEGQLRPQELRALQPCIASLRHNLIDACGLGLFDLGRLTMPSKAHGPRVDFGDLLTQRAEQYE